MRTNLAYLQSQQYWFMDGTASSYIPLEAQSYTLQHHMRHIAQNVVINILSNTGHWQKKSWIAIYTRTFLLFTNYGASDDTVKMGMRHQSPMNPALIN